MMSDNENAGPHEYEEPEQQQQQQQQQPQQQQEQPQQQQEQQQQQQEQQQQEQQQQQQEQQQLEQQPQEQGQSTSKDVDPYPNLTLAGIQIKRDTADIYRSAENFNDFCSVAFTPLEAGTIISNGVIVDLRKFANSLRLTAEQFFSMLFFIAPADIKTVMSDLNSKSFTNKLSKVFDKKVLNEQKSAGRNPGRLEAFLADRFDFTVEKPTVKTTPRKAQLKKKVKGYKKTTKCLSDDLEKAKFELIVKDAEHEAAIASAERQHETAIASAERQNLIEIQELQTTEQKLTEELAAKEKQIDDLKETLQTLEKEKLTLDQRLRGIKSGIARRKSKESTVHTEGTYKTKGSESSRGRKRTRQSSEGRSRASSDRGSRDSSEGRSRESSGGRSRDSSEGRSRESSGGRSRDNSEGRSRESLLGRSRGSSVESGRVRDISEGECRGSEEEDNRKDEERFAPPNEEYPKRDMIIITEAKDKILKGEKIPGDGKRKKKYIYLECPKNSKPCSQVGPKEVQKRARVLNRFVSYMAGSEDEDEKRALYTHLVRANKSLFLCAVKDAGIGVIGTLTPLQAVSIQSLLRLSWYATRNLSACLSNLNMNILPSERKMRKQLIEHTSHVKRCDTESGFIGLRKKRLDENVTSSPFVRVKDLTLFTEEIIKKDAAGFSEDEGFNDEWWLLFAGDKGGKHMKYHVEVVNSLKSGSVDNVHLYCMFEAADSVENMEKVWYPYRSQVQSMMKNEFVLSDGKSVRIFLGGDYHFLDDNMGHQGSSATYPCSLDNVTLEHLQNHGGSPHTPDTCPVKRRTMKGYIEDYNDNLADTRNKGDMHANGHNHNSVVGPMLFPLKDVTQVVPASLHINLGVNLVLFNLNRDECRRMDVANGLEDLKELKKKLDEDWEAASVELNKVDDDLREHGTNVVVMTNRLSRLSAVLDGDSTENEAAAARSDARRKAPKRRKIDENEKCAYQSCFVSEHDWNVQEVCCDKCDVWYHCICEGLTPLEELSLTELTPYICLSCSGKTDRIANISSKIEKLIEEEDRLKEKQIDCKIVCDELKTKHLEVTGEKETQLNNALEGLNVVRQAYHGNVFVGNHCIKILNNYEQLTSTIAENETMHKNLNEVFNCFVRQ